MRFGLEGLRGDRRPHWLGLSQARWMSIIEVGCALRISGGAWVGSPLIYVLFLAILLLALILRRHYDIRPRLLSTSHIDELRTLVFATVNQLSGRSNGPLVATTSHGVKVAISLAGGSHVSAVHISFSMADRPSDLRLLSELAASSVPELEAGSATFTASQVLHTLAFLPLERSEPPKEVLEETARQIYGAAARYFQSESVGTRERLHENCAPDDPRRDDLSSRYEAGPEPLGRPDADTSGESQSIKATVPAVWRRLATQSKLPTSVTAICQDPASRDSNHQRNS
jgi:hypothetical protein